MLRGAVRQFPCPSFLKKKRLQRQIINGLQRQLPWLAAYDRRDSLTVKHVSGRRFELCVAGSEAPHPFLPLLCCAGA